MFTHYEVSENFGRLNAAVQECVQALLGALELEGEFFELPAGQALHRPGQQDACLYRVLNGFLEFRTPEKSLFYFETDDLVGLGDFLRQPEAVIVGESTVVLERFARRAFDEQLLKRPAALELWHRCLELNLCLMTALADSCLARREAAAIPKTRFFAPGSAIIIQDTEPKEIFTMSRGTADVFVGNQKVGEVRSGEIFGALGPAAGRRRSASVIARTACLVKAVPQEQFLALAASHPRTVMKLVEDMARVIMSQNERLVQLEGQEE